MIREEAIYEGRAVEVWLEDVRFPPGIVEAVANLPRGEPGPLRDGSAIVVVKEDPVRDAAVFLARLANYAEAADSMTARQALKWYREGAWLAHSGSYADEMMEETDVLIISNLEGLTPAQLRELGEALEIRGALMGKVTILIGPQGPDVNILLDAYGPRVMRVE